MEILLCCLVDFCLATVPAVAFAMLFSSPARCLPFVALGGGVTHLCRTICMDCFGMGIVISSFAASIIMSLIFIYIGPKLKIPRPVFTVPSIIPVIPGKYAYTTLMSAIEIHSDVANRMQHITDFFQNGMLTVAVMLVLGLGIALPPIFFYRDRPVV